MAEFKYWAFLSYSHQDRKWGDWLHKALETYRFPRRLIGTESLNGKVPQRLYPIFRDQEELSASADLGSRINEALRGSRYLIVICSPHAAQSNWVSQEIIEFKRLGREDRILALIAAGEPNASDGKSRFAPEDECFPKPIRYRLAPNGELSTEPVEPLAADVREGQERKDDAKLKLLAGLVGVNYDDLRQREHERRLRRARIIGAVALALTAIFAAVTAWALIAEKHTAALLAASDSARAKESFDRGDAASALVFLARATEIDPDTRSVPAERLWFALTQRSWPLPVSAAMPHRDAVLSAYFSPDGTKVLTASRDKTAQLWSADSGQQLGATLTHRALVRRAIFIDDGRQILTICFDGVARLWDATSGKPVLNWRAENPDALNSVAVSTSGRYLATGSKDGIIRVWELTGPKRIAEVHEAENVHTLAFHPTDEAVLLSVSGKVARLWKLPSGDRLFEFEHGQQINSASFSPQGDQVLTASSDGRCRLWNSGSGEVSPDELVHDSEVSNALFSPDGKLIAAIVGNRAVIWQSSSKPSIKYRFQNDSTIESAKFSHDGLVLFVGDSNGKVQGWSTLTGQRVGEPIREDGAIATMDVEPSGRRLLVATANGNTRVWLPSLRYPISNVVVHEGAIQSLAVSSDSKLLLTTSDDSTVGVWDLKSGMPTMPPLKHGAAVLCGAFSRDDKYILTGSADGTARFWLTSSGASVGDPLDVGATVSNVAFSPDGAVFATATENGVAQLWNTSSKQPIGEPMTHDGRITSIGFSRGGAVFLTAGWDGKLQIWNSKSSKAAYPVLQSETEITCAQFAPGDDVVAAGSRDGLVKIWSIAAHRGQTPRQTLNHKAAITDLAFSSNGRFIATASEDGTAVIWNVRSGQTVCDPLRHRFAVSAVRFTPDSLKIATASDSTAQVWDVATGAAITESLQHEKPIACLAFSSDGRTLVTGSADRTARIWDLAVDLTPTDRTYLAQFARALSTYALHDSGRLEMRVVDSRERLCESIGPVTGSTRVLMNWFFASPLDRPLTPFTSVTLRTYIEQRSRNKNDRPTDEARFFSDESSSSR